METVAIVGVGLIGGSFALALREAGFGGRIIGVSSERTIAEALRYRVIDEGLSLDRACAQADLVYLAGPIHSILETIPQLDAFVKEGALVTDAGSTKQRIADCGAQLRRAQFLGGHPMAGKESRGVQAAEGQLFAGRPYLLTPKAEADLETPASRAFVNWVRKIGAVPRVLSPAQHDRIVAHSSHLPQLLSTTLSGSLGRNPDSEQIAAAAGPGLVDSTRLALSGWDIWRDILETNRPSILEALDLFIAEAQALRARYATAELEADFAQGKEFALRLRKSR
ncbi:prephenate dehydrogenase [Paludibaculum fermentans]|uniref:Prephenate dehydrogenase/arogenate dehydrogenase family protein n=1 Tax=Paludibaculum fermentans TaxID=1473598 RepID=A0A7S7SLA1_PALFE|nr:prephenate dehydrogenase/arogenate dehydrogenase family protein [Paludibaculum fermentans]QOY87850.1 prephenate dehydrogenase/arogenate dehydrogenase family protein [Paludibaculum fermentans]